MKRAKRCVVELGGVVGVGLVAFGFYQAWPPLGFMALGVFVILGSVGAALGRG